MRGDEVTSRRLTSGTNWFQLLSGISRESAGNKSVGREFQAASLAARKY